MKYRNLLLVFFLLWFTFGIYGFYWYIKTSDEMNKKGANIPIVLLIPILILIIIFYYIYPFIIFYDYYPWIRIPSEVSKILSIIFLVAYGYWVWRYSQGVAVVTGAKGPFKTFLLLFFLGPIGIAIIQDKFNKIMP